MRGPYQLVAWTAGRTDRSRVPGASNADDMDDVATKALAVRTLRAMTLPLGIGAAGEMYYGDHKQFLGHAVRVVYDDAGDPSLRTEDT